MIRSKNVGAVANAAAMHHRVPARSWEYDGESCGKNACVSSPSSTVTSDDASNRSKNGTDDAKEEESMDTAWTDDRHSSYLNSMEEMFVRNMYDREYCAPDICGEASPCEQDCAESRPPGFFKVMQGGGWQPWPCRRLHSWELPSPTIFSSPWVRHFSSSKSALEEQGDPAVPRVKERLICRTSTAYELEDDAPEVPDVENRASLWLERIHGRSTSSSAANSTVYTDKRPDRDDSSVSLPAAAKPAPSRPRPESNSVVDQVVPLRGDADSRGNDRDDETRCKNWIKNEIVSSGSSSSADRNRRVHNSNERRVVPRKF